MKKLLCLAAFIATTVGITGCGVVPNNAPITAAIMLDSVQSANIMDNSVRPVKKGLARVQGIVLFTDGDASIRAAMRNGGITKVHHVDYVTKNILFLYVEQTTIVWGE